MTERQWSDGKRAGDIQPGKRKAPSRILALRACTRGYPMRLLRLMRVDAWWGCQEKHPARSGALWVHLRLETTDDYGQTPHAPSCIPRSIGPTCPSPLMSAERSLEFQAPSSRARSTLPTMLSPSMSALEQVESELFIQILFTVGPIHSPQVRKDESGDPFPSRSPTAVSSERMVPSASDLDVPRDNPASVNPPDPSLSMIRLPARELGHQ